MRFLVVTGLSGAGKTSVNRYLEDMGAFCVDNLPPNMMYKKHQAGVYHGKIKKRQRGKKRAGQADAAALRRFGGSVRHRRVRGASGAAVSIADKGT